MYCPGHKGWHSTILQIEPGPASIVPRGFYRLLGPMAGTASRGVFEPAPSGNRCYQKVQAQCFAQFCSINSGVTSEVHRVRADTAVQEWFSSMNAEQRGRLLADVMAGKRAMLTPSAPPRPSGEIGGRLQVVALRVPRHARWKSEKYAEAEALLAEGQTLTAYGTKWRTEAGNFMAGRMAAALVGLGVLAPVG